MKLGGRCKGGGGVWRNGRGEWSGDRIKILCIHAGNFQRINWKRWRGELKLLTPPDSAC